MHKSLTSCNFSSQAVVPEITGIPLFIACEMFSKAVVGVLKSIATSAILKSKEIAVFSEQEVITILCPFSVANSLIRLPIFPFPSIAIFMWRIYKFRVKLMPLNSFVEVGVMLSEISSEIS